MIKETIVVEGKNDAAAVKRAVDADIIITSGFGLTKDIINLIKTAQAKHGVIILTDPDFMGEKIRSIIASKVKGVKHAFIQLEEARYESDIGIENASPQSILKALSKVKTEVENVVNQFSTCDLVEFGLMGQSNSVKLRDLIGGELGIGYANSKQFLNRLNKYGVTREEFIIAYEKLVKDE
jgi:ribonuclease M5